MKAFTGMNLLAAYCATHRVWGMYARINKDPWDELWSAAPWLAALSDEERGQALTDEVCFLTFESREEMERIYDQTVGDDGPTAVNPYQGMASVYALTISPAGEFLTENT